MTDTDVDVAADAGIKLVDTEGKPLDIQQVRGKMSGDIFIGHDLDSLPPQGAKFVATIAGTAKGGYTLNQSKSGDWILTITLDVTERRSFELLEDQEPNLFEDKWLEAIDELEELPNIDDRSYIEAAATEAREAGWSIAGFTRVVRAAALTETNPLDAVRVQIRLDTGESVVVVPDTESVGQ